MHTFLMLLALAAGSDAARVAAQPVSSASAIKLDGELSEDVWQKAPVVSGFRQREPNEGAAATPPPGMNLINLSPRIADFEDTAAILSLADPLISVDSSPVPLARSPGRPTCVLLPFAPDWRWLPPREHSPWYPSVRLFRQSADRRWEPVIDRVAAELAAG